MPLPPTHELFENGDNLQRFLTAFVSGVGDGEPLVAEVRVLEVPEGKGWRGTYVGFFDLTSTDGPSLLWKAILPYLNAKSVLQPQGIHITLNPVTPDLIARVNHRFEKAGKKELSASAKDVLCRRWLLVDIDPKRPSGVSATDAEKAAANEVAAAVRADLASRGWPAPMVNDSGNGFHLWYRVDLPADDDGAVKNVLLSLAAKHNTPHAEIDVHCGDPIRMGKLPGTWARKGDSIPTRPHRLCQLLEVPEL